MTNADRWQEKHWLDDQRCIDGVLAEAALQDDAELRAALLELRSLRVTEVPEPSPEVAALLGRPATADVTRLEDWPRKGSGKGRVIFTTLAVAASLGVAGGAAAGNDALRSSAEGTISSIVGSLFPPPAKPVPASPAPGPAEAPSPVPAVVLPAPAGTAPAPTPGAERSAGDGRPGTPETSREPQVQDGKANGGDAAVAGTAGKPAHTGASRAAEVPSPANQGAVADQPADNRAVGGPAAGGGKASGNGNANANANANAKVGNDVGTGQDAVQPKAPPAKGSGR